MSGMEKSAGDQEKGELTAAQRVPKRRLVDALNHVNFLRDSIIMNLEHVRYGSSLSLRAYPQPCTDSELQCLWVEPPPVNLSMSYVFRNLMVDRGLDLLVTGAEAAEMTEAGIRVRLPDECRALQPRKARRYKCSGVQATLMQDGASFTGVLEEFTALSFRVLVSAEPPRTFDWIDEETPVYVVLSDAKEMLYSGQCRIIRHTETRRRRVIVLEPLRRETAKLSRDRASSTGLALTPQPSIAFSHPLTGKKANLEVEDLSPCWLSTTEYYDSSMLFPGLIIPVIELETMPGFSVRCRGQVGPGHVHENHGEKTVKWIIAVLDMGIEDQGRLFACLQKATQERSYLYGDVDLDDLLAFFFDTGFVYPKKYAALQSYKEQFKETYRKIYLENPVIARHFIEVDKGSIHGHLSMIRFYENTWIMHHHASRGQNKGGLAVLGQARDYVSDYKHFSSSHMDYLICYFRPNNKFPSRMFGGFAKTLGNPKWCSVDAFACFSFQFRGGPFGERDDDWSLGVAGAEELSELVTSYESSSGGLAMKALDIEPETAETHTIDAEYAKLGLKREKTLFALKKDAKLKAVFMVVVSDVGLNMSNLTNCVHVFVTDPEDLASETLYSHLDLLSPHYSEAEVPVLLYPAAFAEDRSIPYDKIYNLWAFDTRHTSRFYEFMGRILKKKELNSLGRPLAGPFPDR
jgi:hypothetical protein